jgi:hypothetical protein
MSTDTQALRLALAAAQERETSWLHATITERDIEIRELQQENTCLKAEIQILKAYIESANR